MFLLTRVAVVAQLVEQRLVVPLVAGSSPVDRPIREQMSSVVPLLLLLAVSEAQQEYAVIQFAAGPRQECVQKRR